MSSNELNNISDFFGDISSKLESQPIGMTKMGTAGMTSRLHRSNASQFFFKKNYAEMTSSERNAMFGMALATVSAKQATRMVMVALPIMSKIDPTSIPIMKKMAESMPRSNAETLPDSITPVRMAAAFPDIAIVGACLNNQSQVTRIFSRWENKEIYFPTALGFAQAYQLNLDEELKKVASHFNVSYWMDTVKSRLEVEEGPKFNYTYMRTGLEDNYEPYLMKSKMEAPVLALFNKKFDLETLMKYHITVNMAFRESTKVTLARVQEAFAALAVSDEYVALMEELDTLSEVNQDMLPSGEKRLMSNTDAFVTSRNRGLLQGSAAPATTTIIQQAAAPASDQATLRILDEISKRMAIMPTASSNQNTSRVEQELRAKYPRLDDETIMAMALDEIKKNQSKSYLSRFIGW